jgi:predicted ATP-grasp superfamily ATP-dependent carboligase
VPAALRRLRILVYEHASGGGLAGRAVPPALGREGRAMRDALAADLTALGHEVVVSVDPRFPLRGDFATSTATSFRTLLPRVEAAWIIAPETGRVHERVVQVVERSGVRVLGSSSAAIAMASDKLLLSQRLRLRGGPHLRSGILRSASIPSLSLPCVVKPRFGAGSIGVRLIRSRRALTRVPSSFLVQPWQRGIAASVSVLVGRRGPRVLAVNRQSLSNDGRFSYRGGVTPLRHPAVRSAARVARAACRAVPGLRGYVGVDVILRGRDAFVVEINPRLTTAYLGLRASFDANVAGLALDACFGRSARIPRSRRRVSFDSRGRVL